MTSLLRSCQLRPGYESYLVSRRCTLPGWKNMPLRWRRSGQRFSSENGLCSEVTLFILQKRDEMILCIFVFQGIRPLAHQPHALIILSMPGLESIPWAWGNFLGDCNLSELDEIIQGHLLSGWLFNRIFFAWKTAPIFAQKPAWSAIWKGYMYELPKL